MLDLQKFKERQRATSLTAIAETYQNKSSGYVDSRYWKLKTPDKKDGASSGAIIRFLPSHNSEKPFIVTYSYSFLGVGGQYIEDSLESIGQADPVKQYNGALWATGNEDKKLDCKKRPRKMHYVGNILVVKDPARPENDGKVFLFKFGVKIYEKIVDALQGDEVEEREPIDIFDFDEGSNFSINMTYSGKIGFYTYDKSKFLRQSSIGTEPEQVNVLEQIYDLDTCVPVKYKSYDELKQRFDMIMQNTPVKPAEDDADGDNGYKDIQSDTITDISVPKTPKVKITLPSANNSQDDEFAEFDDMTKDIPF